MQIQKLTLTNFRCFTREEVSFHSPFSLLVGDNGAGKTALLSALRVAAGAFLLGVEGLPPPYLSNSDVRERIVPDDLGSVVEPPELRYDSPVEVRAVGEFDGQVVTWARSRRFGPNFKTTSGEARVVQELARDLACRRDADRSSVVLPVLAYYPAGRNFLRKRDRKERLYSPKQWQRGYLNALDHEMDVKSILDWVKTITLAELQQGKPSGYLQAILAAVAACLEGMRRVYYDVQLSELVAVDELGVRRRVHILSLGYVTMLSLILDLASRCAFLNPHLGERVLTDTPGIVLIDELDLHLHPKWQGHVVEDLRRTFPRVQFIAASHSPIVGASLPSDALYYLQPEPDGSAHVRKYQEATLGLSADQMLSSSYFDSPVRASPGERKLAELAAGVSEGDLDAAEAYLEALTGGMEKLRPQ